MIRPALRLLTARCHRCIVVTTLLLASALAWSAPSSEWTPPPPTPDRHDWVQLTSGEWLKGQIKVMYQGSLEFDSDKLKLLKLDMADIKTIRSAQTVSVRVNGGQVATGKLLLEGDQVKVLGDAPQVFAREAVLSVSAGVPKEQNYWNANVSVGGNLSSGNNKRTDVSVIANAERRTVESRIALAYLGNYSVANGLQSANNHRASAVWDWFFSDKLFVRPVFGEYYRDPFQNIDSQFTVGTALGYELMQTPKTSWSVFAGPAYQTTRYSDVPAGEPTGEDTPALSAGTAFRTEIASKVDFTYDYRFQLTSEAAGRYNHHMIGAFSFGLSDHLDLKLSLVWDRISNPAPTADGATPQPNDYQLIFGIGYNF